jgi:thermitase
MRLLKVFVALTLVALVFSARPAAQAPGSGSFVEGQILVKFRPGSSANAKADAHRQNGGRQLDEIARTGVQLVAVTRGDETGAIARYQRNPNVLYAERNVIRRIPELMSHDPGSEVVPGDLYFREQWALHNTGQSFYCVIPSLPDFCFYIGTPDADIDAPEAWAVATGNSIRVAVIDTGIDYTHPDLAANFAGGFDFVNNDGDPMDDHGHGTHVSGTIAAALNNPTGNPAEEEGVVGVAPHALILAYKVCRADGTCDDFAIERAIAQAVTDGARVINMSLGATAVAQSLNESVQDAWNAGLVIVAGAGNDGVTTRFYPAAFDNVISVAAFDEDHRRASFSNYGSWVDISAPGNVILSAYPIAACLSSTTPGDTGCYNWLSGTSMATPHVSGAAALVWSRGDVTTNSQVVDILLNSADPQGGDAVRLDSWTIHGGLNIHNALSYGATNIAPVANAGIDQTLIDVNGDGVEQVSLNGSASTDADGAVVSYEWREGGPVVGVTASPAVWLSVGTHILTLEVTDDSGATDTDDVVIIINVPNQPPVANAGADQTVADGNGDGSELITLNGSASSDPDGTIVSYEWREGSVLVGTGATAVVSLAVGSHTLTLQVIDDDGATAVDSVVVTVNPYVPPNSSHVGDLDGTSTGSKKNVWTARVTITVHDALHQIRAGAIVTGAWSGGGTGSASCTTGSNGTCVITKNVPRSASSVTFTVNSVGTGGSNYSAAQNHDPDGDSTGTAITLFKP